MKKWCFLFVIILFIPLFVEGTTSSCSAVGGQCQERPYGQSDCCLGSECCVGDACGANKNKCIACPDPSTHINYCLESEVGKRKCVVGGLPISYNEVRECKFNSVTNCYMYLQVENCGAGKSCSEASGVAKCDCASSNVCTPGQKRCREVNSLPISPVGPDEIQQCNSDSCTWTIIQSCSMDQDCIINSQGIPQCIAKQCPYCCPSSKTCSSLGYGTSCGSGETCCLSEYYCNTQPQLTTFNYTIEDKKSLYNIGDYIETAIYGMPQIAYTQSSSCIVAWYNNGVKVFYVYCGDEGLGTYGNPLVDLGTLTRDHCYNSIGNVTNNIQAKVESPIGTVVAQSNSDNYKLNCGGTVTTVTLSELKEVLLGVISDYFAHPTNPKLNVNEIKDLIIAYFSASGDTVDLNVVGAYSNEKLIDIYNKAKGNPPSTSCTSAGGSCKTNSCNTYNNCASAQGTCDSGNCCEGTCTLQIPTNAETLQLNFVYRESNGIHVTAGTERVFVFTLGPNMAGMKLDTVGVTDTTDLTFTLTFPDGRMFQGTILGYGGPTLRLWSQHTPAPNLPDEYLPEGTYIFTLEARGDSTIWMEMGVG